MDGPEEPAPGPRDYGCGVVAGFAALMAVVAISNATWYFTTRGVSIGVLLGVGVNLVFWYWVGVGAWRRTIWSRQHPSSPSPDRRPRPDG
jgi:hypothetical protein